MTAFGFFSPGRATQISQATDAFLASRKNQIGGEEGEVPVAGSRYVFLMEDLGVALNPRNGQTQAKFRFLKDAGNVANRNMEDSDTSGTDFDGYLVNRSTSFTAKMNDVILAIPIDGTTDEWAPAISSSIVGPGPSDCSCFCIGEGDITVSSKETTSKWKVSLGELTTTSAEEPNGSVILPANTHELVWNSGAGYWEKSITTELLGFYSSGAPYTITGSPTAWIRYKNADSGKQTLEIFWPNNLVPVEP